jgi:hypothetical protein
VTKEFIDYCHAHRILLAVFPPHSTHTVQPLDVVMFKPLSSSYTKALTTYLQQSLGLVPIRKGDFFPLFWESWKASFKKQLMLKSFAVTSIWPMDREPILKRFKGKASHGPSAFTDGDWRQMDCLIRAAVKDTRVAESKQLSQTVHHLYVQNELLHHENDGLKEALTAHKKHKKRGKVLNLQQRKEYHGGATFWSPRKLRESRAREVVEQREKEELELQKANTKELKAASALYNKKIAEEKRVAREELKVVRDREKAEKVAIAAAKKAALNTKKTQTTAQSGKRKASRASSSKDKRQKRTGGVAARAASPEAAPAAPQKVNRRGRAINVPSKYR